MRLYAMVYPGDSALQTGTAPDNNAVTASNQAAFRASFVRSNIGAESASELRIDVAGIEERARAARSAWIGSKLKSYYEALVRKFERAGVAERENYLAAAQCLAELDERIRREERMQSH
ncbi:MAG: hypothetical protein ACTS6J_09015 [Burkholderiales bacterium]